MKLRLSSFSLSLISTLILVLTGCAEGGSGSSSGTQSSVSNKLEAPAVNLTTENNDIFLDWTRSNADQFRVLYWQGNNAPQEHMTISTAYTLPSLSSGTYTVIVEGFDALGNSLFSAPVTAVIN